MALDTFDFLLDAMPVPGGTVPHDVRIAENGTRFVRERAAHVGYTYDGFATFGTGSKNDADALPYAALVAMFEKHKHSGAFLLRAPDAEYREIAESPLGTGDGVETVFRLDAAGLHRYLIPATVKVYVNAIEQTGNWTLTDNETDDVRIVFDTAPTDTHPVTIRYEYRRPVNFVTFPRQTANFGDASETLANPNLKKASVSLTEIAPGAAYAGSGLTLA